MAQTYKYTVSISGSGYGIWDAEGKKVKGFGSRQYGRLSALKYLYMLNGWDFSRSKYVREHPWLANHKFEWEAEA